MIVFAVVVGVLAGLDVGTTLYGLGHGYQEVAPVASVLVAWLGAWAVVPMRVALTFLAFAVGIFATAVVSNVARLS